MKIVERIGDGIMLPFCFMQWQHIRGIRILDKVTSVSSIIPDKVIVWKKIQFDPIENIIEYIESLEKHYKTLTVRVLNKVNDGC